MSPAGYSATPLIKKLGINPHANILLLNAPPDYLNLLQEDISSQLCSRKQTPDLVHLFVRTRKEFESEMKKLKRVIAKNHDIILWVSWYKKTAKIPTDVTEDVVRNYALNNGLVDVKVCAVSEIWSGLKLVVPVNQR